MQATKVKKKNPANPEISTQVISVKKPQPNHQTNQPEKPHPQMRKQLQITLSFSGPPVLRMAN